MSNKPKTVLILIVGLILVAVGVFASVMLLQRFQASKASTAASAETVKTSVVVATRDMSLGDAITETDVTLLSVPVELAPRDAIATVEETLGKIIKTDLVQGEMVLLHNLADPTNNNKDLSFILSEDHVLFAFPADDLMSRESVVKRGDIVDIFATFEEKVKTIGDTTNPTTGEPKEPEMRTFTTDIMQKVSITAMVLEVIQQENNASPVPGAPAQPTPAPQTRTRAYLLALSPQDALILKHLKDTGATFDLVLRAPTSTVQFDLTPVTAEYIVEYYGLEILP
ncbi:MAG TPA: Flp pilus assembly protein CpaB [Anaerolineaceae bacterium]|nr:Flp pilus assembly protein CpaB [Anaerolineaceae bacterium]